MADLTENGDKSPLFVNTTTGNLQCVFLATFFPQ